MRTDAACGYHARSLERAFQGRGVNGVEREAARADEGGGASSLLAAERAERVVSSALHAALSVAFTLAVAQKHDFHGRSRGSLPESPPEAANCRKRPEELRAWSISTSNIRVIYIARPSTVPRLRCW